MASMSGKTGGRAATVLWSVELSLNGVDLTDLLEPPELSETEPPEPSAPSPPPPSQPASKRGSLVAKTKTR